MFDKKTEMFHQISPCRVSPSLSGDNLKSEVSYSTQIIFNRFCCFSVSLFLLGKESPPLLWRNVIEQMVNENRVMEISFFILSTVSSNVTQNIAWLVSLFCILVIFSICNHHRCNLVWTFGNEIFVTWLTDSHDKSPLLRLFNEAFNQTSRSWKHCSDYCNSSKRMKNYHCLLTCAA